ncbi:hypothetical protein J437_LFUL008237 [Ladona fulva]|uniref:RRM domain-containing protein n=1 Tax=Ladona fulva TaxID=123851 RepID=A0A8K0K620_LADFU|nr:hypothetical protein J437_LFUL008237 [Ladona fulva]
MSMIPGLRKPRDVGGWITRGQGPGGGHHRGGNSWSSPFDGGPPSALSQGSSSARYSSVGGSTSGAVSADNVTYGSLSGGSAEDCGVRGRGADGSSASRRHSASSHHRHRHHHRRHRRRTHVPPAPAAPSRKKRPKSSRSASESGSESGRSASSGSRSSRSLSDSSTSSRSGGGGGVTVLGMGSRRGGSRSASSSSCSSPSSRSHSPPHLSSSKSCSPSHQSGVRSGRLGLPLQSAVSAAPHTNNSGSASLVGSGLGVGSQVSHGEDRRPFAICVRNLPARSSDTSLKDGLFHEYKKHGKVTWVKVVGTGGDRYAVVCFKKPEDVEKALEVSRDKLFFGCKIDVAPYEGFDVDDNEFRPYEAELDEFHPKATRTLFIGNLEKDITASELRKHFEQFGEIIEIDIKKQGSVSSYAFCQYADIGSVVKAMRSMDGEHLGNNRIKLGFGKSMPTNCVWVDGISGKYSYLMNGM